MNPSFACVTGSLLKSQMYICLGLNNIYFWRIKNCVIYLGKTGCKDNRREKKLFHPWNIIIIINSIHDQETKQTLASQSIKNYSQIEKKG